MNLPLCWDACMVSISHPVFLEQTNNNTVRKHNHTLSNLWMFSLKLKLNFYGQFSVSATMSTFLAIWKLLISFLNPQISLIIINFGFYSPTCLNSNLLATSKMENVFTFRHRFGRIFKTYWYTQLSNKCLILLWNEIFVIIPQSGKNVSSKILSDTWAAVMAVISWWIYDCNMSCRSFSKYGLYKIQKIMEKRSVETNGVHFAKDNQILMESCCDQQTNECLRIGFEKDCKTKFM